MTLNLTDVEVIVYCDAHRSLVRVCEEMHLHPKHPAPGMNGGGNEVIERLGGVCLGGMRASLVSGGLPNCFWPLVGHAFAFNRCYKNGAYCKVTGDDRTIDTFVPGQLVFYQPVQLLKREQNQTTD